MDDYLLFLAELGLTQEIMDAITPLLPKPLPRDPAELYYLDDSEVHGTGVFASEDVDGFIGRMWADGEWYEAGRYLNHMKLPNTEPMMVDGVMILVGTAQKGDELFVNYRDVKECLDNG